MDFSPLVVFSLVPSKKQLVLHVSVGVGVIQSADAIRLDKANETLAPTITFEAVRKLRRDLTNAMFLDNIGMTSIDRRVR
jgi:hypothetical protein